MHASDQCIDVCCSPFEAEEVIRVHTDESPSQYIGMISWGDFLLVISIPSETLGLPCRMVAVHLAHQSQNLECRRMLAPKYHHSTGGMSHESECFSRGALVQIRLLFGFHPMFHRQWQVLMDFLASNLPLHIHHGTQELPLLHYGLDSCARLACLRNLHASRCYSSEDHQG